MTKQEQATTEEPSPESTPAGREKLLADRRRKLDKLRDEFGLNPYGQRIDGLISLAEARASYDQAADDAFRAAEDAVREAKKAGTPEDQWPTVEDNRPVVSVAGRVMQHRVMGNLIFMSLRDDTGDIQVGISKKAVGQPAFKIAKATDLSDIVAVRGAMGKTNTGEVTIWALAEPASAGGTDTEQSDPLASGFFFQTKSLALPPGKHHGLTDPETRYRKRYVDLHTNPDVMKTMQQRIQIIDAIRDYMRDKGFVEVETPMLQSLHGGAAARPFHTHHNALDIPLTLRIAPELYLKRLLVGGMRKVFEINRNFRNEGVSPRHNPEFTMLEAYDAYGNWETMADLVEDMVCTVAEKVIGTLIIEHQYDDEGIKLVEDFFAGNTSIESLCQRRMALIDSREDGDSFFFASEAEIKARATASEGYEQGQVGFDLVIQEFSKLIENRNEKVARKLLLSKFATKRIDLRRPWRRIPMVDLVAEKVGIRFTKQLWSKEEAEKIINRGQQILADRFANKISNEREQANYEQLRDVLIPEQTFRELGEIDNPAEQLVYAFEKVVEPTLIDPCFVTRVPGVIIPLARRCQDDDYFADVYELAINGVEISPGYTELNDPDIQEHHFREQVGDTEEQQQVDEDFLEALRVGMPPAGGIGLGIDRLVMMLTGAPSIRDVILFPLMRPQQSD